MFTSWYKSRLKARGGANPEVGRSVSTEGSTKRQASEARFEAEDQDPIFEGGGQVLLHRSYWEKAGWGVAIMVALLVAPCEVISSCV